MTKKINWPIFTDEKATLLIKNRISWLMYYNLYHSISYILLFIIFILIIIWFLSNNYYIAHLNEQYNNNVEYKYIFKYMYNLFPSILSYKDFWYNYNFIHLYLNIIFKAPIDLLKDLLKLYIFIDNRPFDNTFVNVFYNLIFLKYPIKYWHHYLGQDYILYYVKYVNQLRSWQYFPRFWWYWTDWFYSYNKDLPILKFVSPKDRYILYFLDFMRPYLYFLGFYAYHKYATNYDFFLFLNINYKNFMLWGFKTSLYDFGYLNKIWNINSLKLFNFTAPATTLKLSHQNFIYSRTLYDVRDVFEYLKIFEVSFLPHISFFLVKELYLPIYLPIESFQKWVSYKYNGSLNVILSLVQYNIHISTVQDYFKLSILMSLFWKNSYFFQLYHDSVLNIYTLIFNFIFPIKIWFKMLISENIDFSFLSKSISLEWYQFKHRRFVGAFGIWYIAGLRIFILYLAAYIWLFYFLISLFSYYFYKDFWMYKIIWQNPNYLWNIFNVNHDIENDYMLSVDYLRVERYKDYMDIIANLIPVFYFGLASYLMSKVLVLLEGSSGFAAYFFYSFGYTIDSLMSLWAFYVFLPIVWFFLFSLIKKFLFLIYQTFVNFFLIKNSLFLIYILYYVNIVGFDLKSSFLNFNIRLELFDINKNRFNNAFVGSSHKYLYGSNKKLVPNYWPSKTNVNFDYTTNVNSFYNNDFMAYNQNKLKFRINPITALNFVTITNTTWLVMRTNHFYKYYDYIDVNKLTFK